MTGVVVLGATGSIGRQALEVATHLGWPVIGIAARRAGAELAGLAAQHPEAVVVATDPDAGDDADFGGRLMVGEDALLGLATTEGATVVNGIVGAVGLRASLTTLEAGNRLALANKESLIAGGPLIRAALTEGGGELIPVDSEHSALFQCLVGEDVAAVARLVLTASGGPFREWAAEDIAAVTPAQALAHPTWTMGPRITIDSATLVNKGLEVMEAHFLFDLAYDRIDVVVHPQSIVHSLVEFADGSLKAHVGEPDMRVPIQYALTYPKRAPGLLAPFRLAGQTLAFEEPDRDRFPALDLAYAAGRAGGTAPGIFNAADEIAVGAFLAEQIGFQDIPAIISAVLDRLEPEPVRDIETVVAADRRARSTARELVASR